VERKLNPFPIHFFSLGETRPNVRYSLGLEADVMYLEYMNMNDGAGMGIRQMKTRIIAMGGCCELRLKPVPGEDRPCRK
jgi:signal transduction histidine kinase